MKIKVLVLCLTLLWGCSGFASPRFDDGLVFKGYSSDEVWQASVQALLECGYTIVLSDKEGRLLKGHVSYLDALSGVDREITATIVIFEKNGELCLDCYVETTGWMIGAEGQVKNLLAKIKEFLVKKTR